MPTIGIVMIIVVCRHSSPFWTKERTVGGGRTYGEDGRDGRGRTGAREVRGVRVGRWDVREGQGANGLPFMIKMRVFYLFSLGSLPLSSM